VTGPEEWETGLHAHAVGGFIVDERASVGIGAMIVFSRRRADLGRQMLGLGVAGLSTAVAGSDATTRFNLTSAELIGCPLTLGRTLLVRPCALFQAGILDAAGQNITDPESAQDMWWAPGFGVFAEVPANSAVRFQFALRGLVPLNGQEYTQGTTLEVVTQTMPVSPWLSVGAAMVP
jgi:hypothetical protein